MKTCISDKAVLESSGSAYVCRRKAPRIGESIRRTVSIPSGLSAFVGRILHQSWLVNKYIPSGSVGEIELSAARGRRLVTVVLDHGEQVSFRIKHLVAWTQNVKLSTRINLSVAHFASKLNFVQVATGPGSIILEISGEPILISHESQMLPPERLVAWAANAAFTLSGACSWLDVYYNGPLVRIAEGAFGVMDSDDGESRGWSGVWGIVRRLYLP